MATTQDYRQARRIGQISLTDLIARNIAEGGGIGSVGKAVSQKFAAKRTRIREAFDPLNIASMLVGRTKLGTAILGRMMGRSADDIQYFARKGAGREAAYDPFFARISPTSLQPVRQNEGVADVFAKLYALLKYYMEKDEKRKQKQENFNEEEMMEDQRRHKELLEALRGKGKATPVEKKEGGGLFDFIKNMLGGFGSFLKSIKDGLLWLFAAVAPLVVMLGKGLFSILGGLLRLGLTAITSLISFMASPLGLAILAGTVVAYLSKLVAEAIGDWEKGKLKEKGGGAAVDAQREVMKAPSASPVQESYDEFGGTQVSTEAQIAAEKRDALIKEKQDLVWQKMTKKGYPVRYTGIFGGISFENKKGEKAPDELVKKVSDEADAELEVRRKKTAQVIKKDTNQNVSPKGETSSAAPAADSTATSSATVASTPTEIPSSPSATELTTPVPNVPSSPPLMDATNQNMNLQDDYNISIESAPMIFNKSSTNGMNLPRSDMGTVTGAAAVRNDSLDNIMDKLQRRGSVM